MDKIICVGKNYGEHAREMAARHGDAIPEKPVLFMKPPSALLRADHFGQTLRAQFPSDRGEVQPECEIVVKIEKSGSYFTLEEAMESIGGITLGLDMTLREIQNELKKKGHPWERGKVFPSSAIIGPWIGPEQFGEFLASDFVLHVNGAPRQRGRAIDMVLPIAACIAYASEYFPIREGDLLFTGTPAGVPSIQPGDQAALEWNGKPLFQVRWDLG